MTTKPTTTTNPTKHLQNNKTHIHYNLINLTTKLKNMIALKQNNPNLPTPAHIIKTTKDAIDHSVNIISDPTGTPKLRHTITNKL